MYSYTIFEGKLFLLFSQDTQAKDMEVFFSYSVLICCFQEYYEDIWHL